MILVFYDEERDQRVVVPRATYFEENEDGWYVECLVNDSGAVTSSEVEIRFHMGSVPLDTKSDTSFRKEDYSFVSAYDSESLPENGLIAEAIQKIQDRYDKAFRLLPETEQ